MSQHPLLTARHEVEVYLHPTFALSRHFRGGADDTRRPHVLHPDEGVGLCQLESCFQKELLCKGITHLDGGDILSRVFGDVCRGEGATVNPILPRGRTDDKDGVTRPFSNSRNYVVSLHKPYRHRINERIGLVRRVKDHLAAGDRYAKRIAIVTNAAHHTIEQPACPRVVKVTKV